MGRSRSARIEGLTIVNGSASGGEGGGIYCDGASPTIVECRILNCGNARYGGGMNLTMFGGIVDRCVIAGNHAEENGGGIIARFTSGVHISNSIISGNTANIGGGGIELAEGPNHTIVSCTIVANEARSAGGGLATTGRARLDKCIIWSNCADEGGDIYGFVSRITLTCCDVDSSRMGGYYPTYIYDDRCVFADPLFCDPVACGQTTEGDWRLDGSSPCTPEHSPCGDQIGALGQACGPSFPVGACCLAVGVCREFTEEQCARSGGVYAGDGVSCEPDPCQVNAVELSSWGRIKRIYGN
mgnify:CR=1 FL=1